MTEVKCTCANHWVTNNLYTVCCVRPIKLTAISPSQIVEQTYEMLKDKGYTFIYRGLVQVKGKGTLTTYYLTGKLDQNSNNPPHAQLNTINTPL